MSKSLQDRVSEAADRLLTQGRKPTLDAVRLEVGGGSLREISPALRVWREKQSAVEAAASAIPAELVNVVERAAGLIWGEADKRAQEQVAAIRSKFAERIAEVESERDEALNDIARLETQVAEIRQELATARQGLGTLSTRAEHAEAQAQAAKSTETRLLAEIAQANQAAEKAREAERAARDQAAEQRGRIAALEDQLARIEKGRDGQTKQ